MFAVHTRKIHGPYRQQWNSVERSGGGLWWSMQRNIGHWKVERVDQNTFARIKQTRGKSNSCLHSQNLGYAVTRKSSRLSLTQNTRQSVPPDVPASLVTPPENPNSIRTELIGAATFKNLGRRQDQDRVKSQKKGGDFHQLCLDSVTLTDIRASVKL